MYYYKKFEEFKVFEKVQIVCNWLEKILLYSSWDGVMLESTLILMELMLKGIMSGKEIDKCLMNAIQL